MSKSFSRWLAWFLLALSLFLFAASLTLYARIPASILGSLPALWPVNLTDLGLLSYSVIGAIIATRQSDNSIGWIFLATGLSAGVWGLSNASVSYAQLAGDASLRVSPSIIWLPLNMWVTTYAIPLLLLHLFPNGKFLSPRWRVIAWLAPFGILLGLAASSTIVKAGSFSYQAPSLVGLLGMSDVQEPLRFLVGLLFLGAGGLGIAAVVLRMVRGNSVERQQLKWLCYAGAIFVFVNAFETFFFDELKTLDPKALYPSDLFWGIPSTLAFIFLPIATALAIFRYRLYEIDIIIRRSLVFGLLTLLLGMVYFASVVLLQAVFNRLTGQNSDLAIVGSTLMIAFLFTPLRRRVQGVIDRQFYRQAYNASAVLAAFNATARNEVDFARLSGGFVKAVDDTLRPQHVWLWLRPAEQNGRKMTDNQ